MVSLVVPKHPIGTLFLKARPERSGTIKVSQARGQGLADDNK